MPPLFGKSPGSGKKNTHSRAKKCFLRPEKCCPVTAAHTGPLLLRGVSFRAVTIMSYFWTLSTFVEKKSLLSCSFYVRFHPYLPWHWSNCWCVWIRFPFSSFVAHRNSSFLFVQLLLWWCHLSVVKTNRSWHKSFVGGRVSHTHIHRHQINLQQIKLQIVKFFWKKHASAWGRSHCAKTCTLG